MTGKERNAITGAMSAALKNENNEQIKILKELFEFSEQNACVDFNKDTMDHFVWLGKEPKKKND